MRILEGELRLLFQGDEKRCPMAGVRDTRGTVEAAVATPFGLRRVVVELDEGGHLRTAHTFAFDYETGQVTRFDLDISGAPESADRRSWRGSVSGGGLQGTWRIRELRPTADEGEEAAAALGTGARIPHSLAPRPGPEA